MSKRMKIVTGVVVAAWLGLSGVGLAVIASEQPAHVKVTFEDGSGQLSDGRVFCLADRECED